MSLDSVVKGVLDVMTPIITPNWGELVVLIPLLLALAVLAYVAITAARWIGLYRTQAASSRAWSGADATDAEGKKYKRFWES